MRSRPRAVETWWAPLRVLWAVVAAAVIAAVTLWAPVVVLCVLGIAFSTALVPRPVRVGFVVVAGVKGGLAFVVTVAAVVLYPDGLLPGQSDQAFYVETAHAIAMASLTEGTAVLDYSSIVELHNLSYNVLIGWATSLNPYGGVGGASGGTTVANLLSYRFLNILFSTLLLAAALGLVGWLYGESRSAPLYRTLTLWGVGLMPSVVIYSQMVLRDVMIAMRFTAFVDGLVARRPLLTVAVTALMYLTRLQLGLILCVGVVGWVLLRILGGRRRGPVQTGVSLAVLGATAFGATFVFPSVAFVRGYVKPEVIVDLVTFFPSSILGLDVLFAPAEDLALSRAALLRTRLVVPDTFLVPLLAALAAVVGPRGDRSQRSSETTLVVWAMVLVYALSYYVYYGFMFVRLMMPFYGVLFVLALPLVLRVLRRLRVVPRRDRPYRPAAVVA